MLHKAALSGEFEIVKAIIEKVQNKNPKDDDDWTPLHSASLQGIIYIKTVMPYPSIDPK